jgi:hypothetical protein
MMLWLQNTGSDATCMQYHFETEKKPWRYNLISVHWSWKISKTLSSWWIPSLYTKELIQTAYMNKHRIHWRGIRGTVYLDHLCKVTFISGHSHIQPRLRGLPNSYEGKKTCHMKCSRQSYWCLNFKRREAVPAFHPSTGIPFIL